LFIADLIKNLSEDNKDLYREKMLEIRLDTTSQNRLNIEDEDDINEIIIRRRSRTSSIYSAKPIVKYFKMPQFCKTTFFSNLCIDALTKELEVSQFSFILFKLFFK
jgi:hypothetical protein